MFGLPTTTAVETTIHGIRENGSPFSVCMMITLGMLSKIRVGQPWSVMTKVYSVNVNWAANKKVYETFHDNSVLIAMEV